MSRIGRLPIAVPAGVDVVDRRPERHGQGAQGQPLPRAPSRDRRRPRRRLDRRHAPVGGEDAQAAPRPDPDPRQQHGRRRDRRLPQAARDHRRRLSCRARRAQAPAQPGLQPPDRDRPAGGHQLRGREPRRSWPSSASTRSSSARSPHASARPASPSRTRARASATPASRSAARPARPARSAARSNPPRRPRNHRMTALISRGAARQKRHARLRLRVAGDAARPRLAVFRSLNHIYAQVIDDSSGRTLAAASSLEPDLRSAKGTKSAEARRRRAARRRAGARGRRRPGRLRPRRVPVPRSRQVPRRRGPRSRPGFLRSATCHELTPTSSRSRSASSRSTASPRSSRAAGASASAR